MAVMWVCEYIHRRAEKDKILHSKDLHTSIVAAFSCLLSWVTLHPYLLGDKVCVSHVLICRRTHTYKEGGVSPTLPLHSPDACTENGVPCAASDGVWFECLLQMFWCFFLLPS